MSFFAYEPGQRYIYNFSQSLKKPQSEWKYHFLFNFNLALRVFCFFLICPLTEEKRGGYSGNKASFNKKHQLTFNLDTRVIISLLKFGSRKNATGKIAPRKISPQENSFPTKLPTMKFFVNFFLSLIFVFTDIFVCK